MKYPKTSSQRSSSFMLHQGEGFFPKKISLSKLFQLELIRYLDPIGSGGFIEIPTLISIQQSTQKRTLQFQLLTHTSVNFKRKCQTRTEFWSSPVGWKAELMYVDHSMDSEYFSQKLLWNTRQRNSNCCNCT